MFRFRKSYFSYLFKKIRRDPLFLFLGPYQYVMVYLGYKTQRSLAGPLNATISLTYACNLKCQMCDLPDRFKVYEKDEKKRKLQTSDYLLLIDHFRKVGSASLAFTGGEPLLHPSFFELARFAKDKGLVTQVTTNGWLVKNNLERFFAAGLDSVSISLDGATAATHDRIRQVPGSFDRAIEAIQVLVAEKKRRGVQMNINISSTFSDTNFGEALGLVALAEDLGVDYIGFMPVNFIAPAIVSKRPALAEEKIREIRGTVDALIQIKAHKEILETSVEYLKMFEMCLIGKPLPIPCMASYTTFMVDAYGDYFPCHSFYQMEKPWGNYFKQDFLGYWKSQEIKSERQKIKACRDCFWNCQVETNLLYYRLPAQQDRLG